MKRCRVPATDLTFTMKDTELKRERDREVSSTYVRGLEEQQFSDLTEAAEWVQSQQASKFYISSKALVNYIGAIENGKIPPRMYYYNDLKIRVLHVRDMQYLIDHPDHGLSKERICEILVEEPAPQFYISKDYIRIIIQRERVKRRDALAERMKR